MSKKWNMSIPWVKRADYILRCIDEIFAPSNSGNPQFTLKFEVAAPDTVTDFEGEEMIVAGTPIQTWAVVTNLTGNKDNTPEQATKYARDRLAQLREKFELPPITNWDNPEGGFKGKLVFALVDDDEQPQRGSPTKADLAKGIKQGPILMNPKTKKPLISHYPKIVEFYGIAELPSNQAF